MTLGADASGTWATDNTAGLVVNGSLKAGSSVAGVAGAWGGGAVLGSTNQFNFMGSNGNVFELFDVGLYEGAVAPAFQLQNYDAVLRDLQPLLLRLQFRGKYRSDLALRRRRPWRYFHGFSLCPCGLRRPAPAQAAFG